MSAKYKTSCKVYPAWNYQEEIEDLNRASENGWQLIKGGCFHSRFVKNSDICYRYQLDYRKIDDMGRYIETFREQGWEYVSSTFNGWHFFRKIYDPSLPEESYEIFTDSESLREMNHRWVRLANILGAIIGILAIVCLVRMIMIPHLPVLVQLLTLAVESAILFYGGHKMRNRESGGYYRGSRALFAAFLCFIAAGCAAGVILTEMRPDFSGQSKAEELAEPITDDRWASFDVRYSDNYYLALDMKADVPFSFEITDDNGAVMYSEKGTDVHEKNIRVKLPKGRYWLSLAAGAGFELSASIG